MNHIKEAYMEAFKDEMQKIAYEYGQGIFKKNPDITKANVKYDEKLKTSIEKLDEDLEKWDEPQSKRVMANRLSALGGGALAALPSGKHRFLRALGGLVAGTIISDKVSTNVLEKKYPGFVKGVEKAYDDFVESDHAAFVDLEKDVARARAKANIDKIKNRLESNLLQIDREA